MSTATTASVPGATTRSFDEKLDCLAQVAVHAGLGLAPGQPLVMTAGIDTLPLVRRITEHAYRAGATLVTTLLGDEPSALLRYRFASDASFDAASGWLYEGMAAAFRSGAARLAVAGANPALLSQQDPDKVARANRAQSRAYQPALELITNHHINWTIVAAATPAWAASVFPSLPPEAAERRLWDAIFAASRVDLPDPVAAWKAHDAKLHAWADRLTAKQYQALQFRGPGTDLKVGLSDGHCWRGGGMTANNGIYCIPNLPTEEVFTTPHKDRVEGVVTSTKPLSYQGTLIEKISVRFAAGAVVEAHAATGEQVLQQMLSTDAGARRLGEVSLVPNSSPISASGLLFNNTLFDENAACHIALGQSYSHCLQGGDKATRQELAARGANESLIHVDWMIGSGQIDVDGLGPHGAEPVLRQGEWV